MAENENGRPGKGGPRSSTPTKNTPDSTPARCQICASRIYAVESIRVGIGRDCRRRLLKMLTNSPENAEPRSERRKAVPSLPKASLDLMAVHDAVATLRAAVDALAIAVGVSDD